MYKIKTIIIFIISFWIVEVNLIAQEVQNDSVKTILSSSSVEDARQAMEQRRKERGLIDLNNVFIPKGQWVFGGTASYSTHTNDNYSFLIIEGIDSQGYNFNASPLLAYALRDNMAIGARFIYGRSLIKIDNASLSFGDGDSGVNITLGDYYGLKHSYSGVAILRQYIPLGANKRFALFNEIQLNVGGSQSKFTFDSPVKGTYSTSRDISLGISPGIVAFATNNVAFEVSVGVMGLSYSHTKQVHNQVTVGDTKSSAMNLKINIFSIGLGVSFYL